VSIGVQKSYNRLQVIFGKSITIRNGMSAGLPLANPAQRGTLTQGTITQAFGNWIGTDQTLDLIFIAGGQPQDQNPGPYPQAKPRNLVLNWAKGTGLQQALQQTLQQGFPGFKTVFNLTKQMTADHYQIAYFGNFSELAQYICRYTQKLGGAQYQGVGMVMNNGMINVHDSPQTGAGQIAFQDLIGQPTWIETQTIQVKTVMRGDIKVGDSITLPQTLVTQTQGAR